MTMPRNAIISIILIIIIFSIKTWLHNTIGSQDYNTKNTDDDREDLFS